MASPWLVEQQCSRMQRPNFVASFRLSLARKAIVTPLYRTVAGLLMDISAIRSSLHQRPIMTFSCIISTGIRSYNHFFFSAFTVNTTTLHGLGVQYNRLDFVVHLVHQAFPAAIFVPFWVALLLLARSGRFAFVLAAFLSVIPIELTRAPQELESAGNGQREKL
jgi:hypothetical protein